MKNRLRKLRIEYNYSEEKIANVIGISKNIYIKYELSNKPLPLWLLIKISKIYNTSIDYIVCETDDKNRY